MTDKLKIGLFFGGPSREREISFRGGKTAYEHIDKSIFEPVLIFVDSLGNFIEIAPEILYYDSIRDFYPSKNLNKGYRIYIESLGELNDTQLYKLIYKIGKQIKPEKLKETIDIAFPVMHGPYAEDGSIQGLFDWYGIPYVGPNLLGSSIGINKPYQNQLLAKSNGQKKVSMVISRAEWEKADRSELFSSIIKSAGFPFVIKAPHQGSSIGVGIVKKRSLEEFTKRMHQCLFDVVLTAKEWSKLTRRQKKNYLEKMLSINEGIAFPVVANDTVINHPADMLKWLDAYLKTASEVTISSVNAEDYVLIEEFIEGQEFSIGLIQDNEFNTFALPPTEIYGEIETFDFKSKYQSNVTKKRIPIDTSMENLQKVEAEAVKAFNDLGMNVICRIDGFVTPQNQVIFHDPNTLPGMSPTSLIFKQMAEIGLNITNAINYLIRQSLQQRKREGKNTFAISQLIRKLDDLMTLNRKKIKTSVAIIFGENENEYLLAQQRYNELAASEDVIPTCICAAKNGNFYTIPLNLMYKVDILDFGQSIGKPKHPFVQSLIDKTAGFREQYAGNVNFDVAKITEDEIERNFDQVLYMASVAEEA